MTETGVTILYVLFLWWFGTGIILYLDRLPRRTFPVTLAAATGLLAAAFASLALTKDLTTPYGAIAAFTAVIVVWGWNEVAFLTGYVTGPNRAPCPPDATGWRRFRLAASALMHHELALLASGVAILALTWGGANHFGPLTFALLWVMRLSTKLNIFFGVPYNAVGYLPPHVAYLETYFRQRAFNWFFPVSAIGATIVVILLVAAAASPERTHAEVLGFVLLTTLAALGLFEHWVLMLPVRMRELWRWALTGRRDTQAGGDARMLRAVSERFDVRLSSPCDARGLSRVLDGIASGEFGEIRQVSGIARAERGFIHFGVDEGRARMSEVTLAGDPDASGHQTWAIAFGRAFDTQRLQAAFDGCALRAAA